MRVHAGAGPRVLICTVAVTGALLVGPAAAAPAELLRVEVSTSQVQRSSRLSRQFEHLVKREVQRLSLKPARDGKTYVLSAALVELKTRSRQDRVTTTCSVSLALRDQRSGCMRAVMRGSAHATDARRHAPGTRATAMRVAVLTALSRLPGALG